MNIYKFTKNTVELSQYYKNIDSIYSIIIIGNTCGLCGWFKLIENDKWEDVKAAREKEVAEKEALAAKLLSEAETTCLRSAIFCLSILLW